MHGETYNYCYVSKKRWDYCTPSKDPGQDPHCILKTYHLLWIGCIIAVFIAICIFYCRKKYQIQSAEVQQRHQRVEGADYARALQDYASERSQTGEARQVATHV